MILETDNPAILESIKRLFKKDVEVDFWKTLSPAQQEDILLGLKDIEDGKVIDYEDFMKRHR